MKMAEILRTLYYIKEQLFNECNSSNLFYVIIFQQEFENSISFIWETGEIKTKQIVANTRNKLLKLSRLIIYQDIKIVPLFIYKNSSFDILL